MQQGGKRSFNGKLRFEFLRKVLWAQMRLGDAFHCREKRSGSLAALL